MDLNKAILYGQLVNEAYKVPTSDLKNRAGTTLTAERGRTKQLSRSLRPLRNDLAKDAKKPGRPIRFHWSCALAASTGEAVSRSAYRRSPGMVQDAQIGTEKCPFTEAGDTEDGLPMCTNRLRSALQAVVSNRSLATIFGSRQVNSLTIADTAWSALATLQALDVAATVSSRIHRLHLCKPAHRR